MQILMLMYVGFSLVLVILAIPLWLAKIPPNGVYGFRVKKTIEDEKTWYAVNKYCAPWLIASGFGTAFAAIGLHLIPGLSVDVYALAVLGLFGVIFGLGLGMTVRYMNSL